MFMRVNSMCAHHGAGPDGEVPGLSHPTLTFAPGRSVTVRYGASVRGTRFFEKSCSVPPLKALLEGDGLTSLIRHGRTEPDIYQSSTSRIFRPRVSDVNGLCRNAIPGLRTPCWTMASSVYPDM